MAVWDRHPVRFQVRFRDLAQTRADLNEAGQASIDTTAAWARGMVGYARATQPCKSGTLVHKCKDN
jgi:hypothetical protein